MDEKKAIGFDKGSLSFRAFYLSGTLPADVIERFARHAIPPIDTMGKDPICGWSSSRHLLDRQITEDNVSLAGYLSLTLVKAEKKIPAALFKAECKMEELALLQANGNHFPSRSERASIHKSIVERMLPSMPATLSGIAVLIDLNFGMVYAKALSESQVDVLVLKFTETTGVKLIQVTPQSMSLKRHGISIQGLEPTSFSAEIENRLGGSNIGHDFLTWLWFFSEAGGGTVEMQPAGTVAAIAIEGPLKFFRDGNGAHETVLRNGSPLMSDEAKIALISGKKLVSAKILIACGDNWMLTFNAGNFVFRGLKIPRTDDILDSVSLFQYRMLALRNFMEMFFKFFDVFIRFRVDMEWWPTVQKHMQKWVADRRTQQ